MANPQQFYIEKPIFQGAKNTVIKCADCDWSFVGPRTMLRLAWNDHYRQNHSEEVGTAIIDKQMRQEIWLPGAR